jgi:hypothetical protein
MDIFTCPIVLFLQPWQVLLCLVYKSCLAAKQKKDRHLEVTIFFSDTKNNETQRYDEALPQGVVGKFYKAETFLLQQRHGSHYPLSGFAFRMIHM